MKLRYDTKRNPVMTAILIFIGVVTIFSVMRADLTSTIFGEIGKPASPQKNLTKEQYADVAAIWKQQNAQRDNAIPGQATGIVTPREQVPEQRTTQPQIKEPGAIYHYTDAGGALVMVDDLEKVPQKYRAKMKTTSGGYGQQHTAVTVRNNQIWVPVTFGHKGATVTSMLLLDTGATNTSISPALARRLGVQATETASGTATLADGSVVRTAHVVVDYVSVGPKVKRDVNVQIMPRTGDEETGLLGMNFLGDFPHTVVARMGIIRWQ